MSTRRDRVRLLDRYVRIPFAEVTLPVRTTFFSLGYERRQAVLARFLIGTLLGGALADRHRRAVHAEWGPAHASGARHP